MKIIITLLILIKFLSGSELEQNITLLDFSEIVSTQNNINIYIDEDLKSKEVSFFVPDLIADGDLLYIYIQSLKKLGYELTSVNDTYYVTKILDSEIYSYFVPLVYNSFDNVSKYLTFKKIDFQYIDTTNTFVVYCVDSKINSIIQDVKEIDIQKKQVVLKFTIIEINEDLLRESGFEYSSSYTTSSGAVQNVLNSFILPFQSTNPVFQRSTFYGALKLFSEENVLKVEQNPYILVQDSKDFLFQAVTNIPYQTSTTLTQATNTSEQTSIEYRDVGLKVVGKSLIYSDYVNLDLDLIIEDILNSNSNIPTTYKRQLKSNTNLKYGEVLVLSGIKQIKSNKREFSIPFISDIPYLGELFKYKSSSDINSNISIAIEVLKSGVN
ncbi:MAG TPA: hypothetical protein VLZ29_01205 [Sulfurimonas sp.]|uniref:type II secretion system protein GspD n=1 Tax=Sulfurimonas sp. TaxID=2022749 RepID=UPI002C8D8BDD|nr:hypothetical protein [Sulfurimonas sp.]HUH41715.1 hypothetical protein [Sulfurimonas sp.]